jgi:hypothetical protein
MVVIGEDNETKDKYTGAIVGYLKKGDHKGSGLPGIREEIP